MKTQISHFVLTHPWSCVFIVMGILLAGVALGLFYAWKSLGGRLLP